MRDREQRPKIDIPADDKPKPKTERLCAFCKCKLKPDDTGMMCKYCAENHR
ncbi:hypothetical protein ACQR1I_14255 [Bradyrhizobium sp. HKCCYLS2038]|uniref:hypothetical protein n=1 Tax=unclassified Bradyrhizobium TaxID=2631580 RepID=UPI003EBBE103